MKQDNTKQFNIYLVGVGGQGVLTIGDILTQAALRQGISANFYPTKGMAQRGGFVKAQLRLGRKTVGPTIPEKGADLVIAMEMSEALKAVRFIKPGGDFVLYGHVWRPTAVMLGKDPYPQEEQVTEQVKKAGGELCYIEPSSLPDYQGNPIPENVFVLGAAAGKTKLREVLDPQGVAAVVQDKWKKHTEVNAFAFESGLKM